MEDYLRPQLRDLHCVQRWSIVPMFRRQSTAEHSYFVTLYAMQLYEIAVGQMPGPYFIQTALEHDMDEIHSGDIPTPYKRKMGLKSKQMPEGMDPLDWQIIKIADILEAYLFLLEEKLLGNYKAIELERQLKDRLWDECVKLLEPYKNKIMKFISLVMNEYVGYKGRVE